MLRTPGGEQRFFVSWDLFGTGATDLWRTDGTIDGTVRLTRFLPGRLSSASDGHAYVWMEIGQWLFFPVSEASGSILWVTDGPPAGNRPVYSFVNRGAEPLAAVGDRLLIAVTTFVQGSRDRSELWVSDGSTTGTLPLVEAGQGVDSALTVAGRAVLLASDRTPGRCGVTLWSTDGTAAGTQPLETFDTPGCAVPSRIDRAGDWGVFTAASGAITNLWRTDGTASGTGPVTAFTSPDAFAVPGGAPVWQPPYLYFVAGHLTAVGAELWRSQGSPETTELVVDLNPGLDSSQPTLLDAIGDDRVLFRAGDFVTSDHPWITDGTAAGTRRIAEVQIGWHTVLAGRLVFGGFTQAEGWALWGADLAGGEAARLSDLDLTFGVASSAHSAGRIGDLALFAAADSLHGNELWRSDGTAGGTYRLANLAPDGDVPQAPPQVPANLAVVPISQDVVRVRWDAVPGAQRYFLSVRGIEGTPPFQDQPIFETMELFIVPPGSPISVQVRAENAHGSSTWSDEVSATAFEPWLLPPGQICGRGDTSAFGNSRSSRLAASARSASPLAAGLPSSARFSSASAGPCQADGNTLCLLDGRYEVQVDWRDQHNDQQGVGRSVPFRDLSGFFLFFHPDNIELVVKLLDGTPVNGNVWVFYGALSDVGYTLRVRETATGDVAEYVNPPGNICGGADTAAF